MFGVGFGEGAVLVVLAIIIFGPDQLPRVAAQAGRALRQLRTMANSAKQDLQEGLGPEFADFDLADLNPRRFVTKHLLDDLDDLDVREPARDDSVLPYGERPPYDPEAT
ncbi:sec-independent translocase [Actinoallomurus spadix]|uniref:Sec-independent protein translocase protein TatB n=1 Tax=Actinoallomurus spadix TaxID=79912 RepID=A0ABP3HA69_9ACTN|nr:sec-independent translocase [Actinoallomurus spadix]MCO5988966.1 sec-independent translocase [Actinoallomurus spadix]